MNILEVLMDLNKALMINGYDSDYKITLSNADFNKFAVELLKKESRMYFYPEPEIEKATKFKLAGPGCYFWIYREVGEK